MRIGLIKLNVTIGEWAISSKQNKKSLSIKSVNKGLSANSGKPLQLLLGNGGTNLRFSADYYDHGNAADVFEYLIKGEK